LKRCSSSSDAGPHLEAVPDPNFWCVLWLLNGRCCVSWTSLALNDAFDSFSLPKGSGRGGAVQSRRPQVQVERREDLRLEERHGLSVVGVAGTNLFSPKFSSAVELLGGWCPWRGSDPVLVSRPSPLCSGSLRRSSTPGRRNPTRLVRRVGA
jgi:hypothetical protein